MRKKRRRSTFIRLMVGYAVSFLLIVAICMCVTWLLLSRYEKSQPQSVVKNYILNISKKDIQTGAKDILDRVNPKLQSQEDALTNLYELIHNESTYAKDTVNSTQDSITYFLRADDIQYGTVSLKKSKGSGLLASEEWVVENHSLDYNSFLTTDVVSVPAGWSVKANDVVIDDTYITNWEKHYTLLNSFYGDWNSLYLPYLYEYSISDKVGHFDITVTDSNGNSYDYKKVDESMFLGKADEETSLAIQNFMYAFLPQYIQCLSNSNHNAYANYQALVPYMLPGSNLDTRVYNAIEGQAWANSNGDIIIDIQFNDCVAVGDGKYISDVTYVLETYGLAGAVQTEQHARVLIIDVGGFVAADIESY